MSGTPINGNRGKEPTREPDSSYVNLKVNGQDGSEVFFKVLKKTQLRNLMNKYCQRQGLDRNEIAFLVDGHQITGSQTADELGLEDKDEIDAMKHHGGGGSDNDDNRVKWGVWGEMSSNN